MNTLYYPIVSSSFAWFPNESYQQVFFLSSKSIIFSKFNPPEPCLFLLYRYGLIRRCTRPRVQNGIAHCEQSSKIKPGTVCRQVFRYVLNFVHNFFIPLSFLWSFWHPAFCYVWPQLIIILYLYATLSHICNLKDNCYCSYLRLFIKIQNPCFFFRNHQLNDNLLNP